MAKDRINVSKQYKKVVDDMRENNVLGFNNLVENKEVFLLAVALGLNDSAPLESKQGEIRYDTLENQDKALMSAVLLGTVDANDDEKINELTDFEKVVNYCEMCAEAGYRILQEKYNDSGCDTEILEQSMLRELKTLYLRNVETEDLN